MANNILTHAKYNRIGDNATFQNVGGNATTNIYNNERGDLVNLYGNVFRRFPIGDIIVQKNVSSNVVEVTITPRHRTSVSSSIQSPPSNVVKVRKTVQHVHLIGLPGEFTSLTLERVEGNLEDFDVIIDRVCREVASVRSPLLTHLVGLGWSERLTLIVNDQSVNGEECIVKVEDDDNWTLSFYLEYTQWTSFSALRGENTLAIPVFSDWDLWSFNPRTHAWQYDLASVSISQSTDVSINTLGQTLPSLCLGTRPQLNSDEIIASFEGQFGSFLHPIASFGETRRVVDLSDFARHGLLTFGTVVNRNKPGILAHFASIPLPEWDWNDHSTNLKANYSASVPSRVDLSFRNTGHGKMNIHFSLTLSDPIMKHRAAYLSQSLAFYDGCDDPNGDLVFIHEVRFSLVGTFHYNPTTSPTPIYLFVPPIHVEKIDALYSIHYPLPSTLFYWSLDQNGHTRIPRNQWKTYGIPTLEVFPWIGASWSWSHYENIRGYLQKKNLNLDGKQYAQDHCYPELIHGDPHNPRIVEVEEPNFEEMDCSEDICAPSGLFEHEGKYPSHRIPAYSDIPIKDDKMKMKIDS